MQDDLFETSGKPNYIEWYKCYDDPSKDTWIDGMEFKNNPQWDELQKLKWNYFYRPLPSLVGRPQKRTIKKLQKENKALTEQISELNKILIFIIIGAVIGFLVSLSVNEMLVLLAIIAGVVGYLIKFIEKSNLTKILESNNTTIIHLRKEIEFLKQQIPERPPSKIIEKHLIGELRAMEMKCLSEIINANVDHDKMDDLIRHEPISDIVRGLLIQGWGLLQPSSINGPFGSEKTGFDRVTADIGNKIATWRISKSGSPLYRVLYIQYIFLLDKNINVYGFFYDFITRKPYGKRSETFQYNHVSNFSIREVELDGDEFTEELYISKTLTRKLFNKEINAFTLAVTSGEHFRCVLIDDAVVEGMNEWLDVNKMFEEALSYEYSDLPNDSKLKEKWGSLVDDDIDKGKILQEIVREKLSLEQKGIPVARKALQQVRIGVERSTQVGAVT